MKHLLLTTIAAVLVVGCGESQQSAPSPETPPVEPVAEVPAQPSPTPVETKPDGQVAEAAKLEPPPTKAPAISIHDAAEKGDIEAVKQHLAAGTDVNTRNDYFATPLHEAALMGHNGVAELLIAKGADVNAKDVVGNTSLHRAALYSHTEIVELLIAKGADVNAQRGDGKTPLDGAMDVNAFSEIADLLRKHGGKTGEELKAEGN